MAFNQYDAVRQILNSKNDYESTIGDDEQSNSKRQAAATYAQKYYNDLIKNGYNDVASQLKNTNYDGAVQINNGLKESAKKGRVSTRNQFYTLGQKYGQNQSEIDKLLGYDQDTGEVSFGGQNLGSPLAEVDGVSYYDPITIQNAYTNYIKQSGTTPDAEKMYLQGQQTAGDNLNDNRDYIKNKNNAATDFITNTYNDNADYTKNFNPYTSDIGKSILDNYNLQGYDSANNAKAESASSNGGNIDSYAAANASRQQLAYKNAGMNAVLQDYANKLGYLWGGYDSASQNLLNNNSAAYQSLMNNSELEQTRNQSLFDNSETAKNNEITRQQVESEITGNVPYDLANKRNPYEIDGGELRDGYKDTDFQTTINSLWDQYTKATDNATRRSLTRQINYANDARNKKIQSDPNLIAQYGNTMIGWIAEDTANMRKSREELESAERISSGQNETNLTMNQSNNDTSIQAINEQGKVNDNSATTTAKLARADQMMTSFLSGDLTAGKWLVENGEISGDVYNSKKSEIDEAKNASDNTVTAKNLEGSKPYTKQADVPLKQYDNTDEGNELLTNRWVNWLENLAKDNGQPQVFTQIDDKNYRINTLNTDYKQQVVNRLRQSYDAGEMRQDQYNYLIHAFGLI